VNCKQARSMLATYRELNHSQVDTIELDAHLEECAECRRMLSQQDIVSKHIRLLPTIEPAANAQTKLMHALATEHARFLQRSSKTHTSSASAVPDFLKPYMKEQTSETSRASERLAAFSSAETGPLPFISMKRKKRIAPMGQLAVLGLAASFLLVFLIGGLVSLLLLANHGDSGSISTSISRPSLVAPVNYTVKTLYPHITSAVATREHIYYSAYGDGKTPWMIEQVNDTTKDAASTPLLAEGSNNPLFVLGASQQWLIWLQLDTPQRNTQGSHVKQTSIASLTRSWSLNALSLTTPNAQPILLQNGVFDTATVPSWTHTPIQGLWFIQQDTLLVTTVDAKGNAQLVRYQLLANQGTTSTNIATASGGHILTSPTATADGSRIFWSEEWFSNDMQPHSNIWTQMTTKEVTQQHGVWRPSIVVNKQLFRSDGMSFHPQVINDTLFLLSTGNSSVSPQATSTPAGTAVAPTAILPTPVVITPVIPRFTDVYPSQIDESIHGTLLAIALDNPTAQPTTISSDNTAAAPQAGTRFLVWQSSAGYQMYDAVVKSFIEVNSSTKSAAFLAVNSDTAVWVAGENSKTKNTTTGIQTATFSMFNWPT